MTVFDVVDFATMDEFIKEKNHILNCFEDQVLQQKVKLFVEKELFFLVKHPNTRVHLEELMEQYSSKIYGKYSPHQLPRLAICNQEGDFWVKTEVFSHYAQLQEGEHDYCRFVPVYNMVYQKFLEAFQEGVDYQVLYEDDNLTILVFLLRVSKCFFDDGTLQFHIEENGYYVDPKRSCDILPYDTPYRYSYQVIPYHVLKENMSYEEFFRMKEFYLEGRERQRKK